MAASASVTINMPQHGWVHLEDLRGFPVNLLFTFQSPFHQSTINLLRRCWLVARLRRPRDAIVSLLSHISKNTPETKKPACVKDSAVVAVVLPAASCLDQPVVVPVSSVLVLPCGGVDWLPPALEAERVRLLIKVDAVFLPIILFLYSAQSN